MTKHTQICLDVEAFGGILKDRVQHALFSLLGVAFPTIISTLVSPVFSLNGARVERHLCVGGVEL